MDPVPEDAVRPLSSPPAATLATEVVVPVTRWKRFVDHFGEKQHRNAYYLILNTVTGSAAGLLFWFLLARQLPAADIGLGLVIISLGTTVGVLSKGGFDMALLRTVPVADSRSGRRLLLFAVIVGVFTALLISAGLAGASALRGIFPQVGVTGWILVASIGSLLVLTWLQDAHFLAEGDAKHSFQRNVVFSISRILLPLPLLFVAIPNLAASTWAAALFVSATAAWVFAVRLPARDGRRVRRRELLQSAMRNVSGSATEFLPGLLLAPMVLAINGPAAAAYFGIAWTAASLLFLAIAAISRSALAELVRGGPERHAAAVRKCLRHNLYLIGPASILGALLAPVALSVFGADYAREGGRVLTILCASTIFVAPAYAYLAVLRARERPVALIVFPAAMVVALAILAPLAEARYGLPGVALAWLVANAPFGLYAAWRLRSEVREVNPDARPAPVHRAPNPE